jgi:ubiquinone/menaquinone biosynthesis C-methylase UbiE
MEKQSVVEEIEIQNKIALLYDEKRYHSPHSLIYHRWWIEKMVSTIEGKEELILDNGCGVGISAKFIPELTSRLIGIDISKNMILTAKRKIPLLVLGDSHFLPFADSVFAAVISRSLLHHMQDPLIGVKEMVRILKPRGEIVLSETLSTPLSKPGRFFLKKFSGRFSKLHKNFSKDYLLNLLEPFFVIETVLPFGFIAYPLMGFPDIIDFSKLIPLPHKFCDFLIQIDEKITRSRIGQLLAWGIIVKGRKK